MKAPRSTRCTLRMGTVCLVLMLLFLAGCSMPRSTRTAGPEPPQISIESSAEEAFETAEVLRRDQRHAAALQAFRRLHRAVPRQPAGRRRAVGRRAIGRRVGPSG